MITSRVNILYNNILINVYSFLNQFIPLGVFYDAFPRFDVFLLEDNIIHDYEVLVVELFEL